MKGLTLSEGTILLKDAKYVIRDASRIEKNLSVEIRGGLIICVAESDELKREGQFDEVIEGASMQIAYWTAVVLLVTFAFLFLGELLTGTAYLGGGLIFLGALLVPIRAASAARLQVVRVSDRRGAAEDETTQRPNED